MGFHRTGLSRAGDSSPWSIKTDLLGSLGSRVINDFISVIVGGAFSTFYLSIQMEAAVSRDFHMVLIGLSYTGNNSAGKCLEQATQTVGSAYIYGLGGCTTAT